MYARAATATISCVPPFRCVYLLVIVLSIPIHILLIADVAFTVSYEYGGLLDDSHRVLRQGRNLIVPNKDSNIVLLWPKTSPRYNNK